MKIFGSNIPCPFCRRGERVIAEVEMRPTHSLSVSPGEDPDLSKVPVLASLYCDGCGTTYHVSPDNQEEYMLMMEDLAKQDSMSSHQRLTH